MLVAGVLLALATPAPAAAHTTVTVVGWDSALRAYSDGSYGAAYVAELDQEAPAHGAVPGDRLAVARAANRTGVPFAVLWGVYGAESSWGRGGSNWFGLIAVPRTGSFAGDALASARALRRCRGSRTC